MENAKFTIAFLAWYLPVYGLFYLFSLPLTHAYMWFLSLTPWISSGNTLLIDGSALTLDTACIGIAIFAMFTSFVIAFGFNFASFLAGIGLIFLLNMLRIFTLGLAAMTGVFDIVHNFLWPSTFFLFAGLAAYLHVRWIRSISKKES